MNTTANRHIETLLPRAQKHADHYGVDWMVCTMDDGEETGWHIRPLSYATDPEFEAFDGVVEVVVEPRTIPPAGSQGSEYGYDDLGRLCRRDTGELIR